MTRIIFTIEQEEEIIKLYINFDLNIPDIAQKFNCSISKIQSLLKERNILRTHTEAQIIRFTTEQENSIIEMYIKNKINTKNISKKFNVSKSTIERLLKRKNVLLSHSESQKRAFENVDKRKRLSDTIKEYCKNLEVKKKKSIDTIKQWKDPETRKILINSIKISSQKPEVKKRRSDSQKERTQSPDYVHPMLGKHHSEKSRKRNSESHIGLQSGEKHPNFKNWSSRLPYCFKFTPKLKETIRIRDSYTCQLCGVIQNGRKHTCHHIHYDKQNCYPDLICLCNSCNAKVNFNRSVWEQYFMNKLNDRGLLLWTRKYEEGKI